MRSFILAFFLLSVAIIKAQDPTAAYFYLVDSSTSTVQSQDGESQFFDYPTGINIELPVNTSAQVNLFQTVFNFLVNNFSIPAKEISHGHVRAIKTYWRNSGYLPLALVQNEMALSNANAAHIPDLEATMASVEYLFYKMAIPEEQHPYLIKHQLSEICVQFPHKDFRHFIVDRGYRGIYPDTWNSRIRVIHIGRSSSCDLKDTASWADLRSGTWNDNGVTSAQLNVLGQGKVDEENYHLDDLFADIFSYFQKFPNYNTLYNCQHFGTNLFNKLTGKNLTFPSVDVMEIVTNGVSNLPKLQFGFNPLPSDEDED